MKGLVWGSLAVAACLALALTPASSFSPIPVATPQNTQAPAAGPQASQATCPAPPPTLARRLSFPTGFHSLPGAVPALIPSVKRALPRSKRAAERVRELTRTVATIKQELTRRDVFKSFSKKLAQACILLPAFMTNGVQKAYGEAVAAAADKCPDLKALGRQFRPADFTEDHYLGTWYEIAYHDVTQANYFCGCTRFNFTKRTSTYIEDMFTTTCPMTGVLPGEEVAKSVYTLNMSITFDSAKPGEFLEKGFAYNFPDVVLYVWKKIGPDGKEYYDRSLQMQCVEAGGKILFVGINFLARSNKISKPELDEMFAKAAEVGIDRYGGDRAGMYMVVHEGCRYPLSTDASVMGPRSDFPGPITKKIELVTYPDPRVDVFHKF